VFHMKHSAPISIYRRVIQEELRGDFLRRKNYEGWYSIVPKEIRTSVVLLWLCRFMQVFVFSVDKYTYNNTISFFRGKELLNSKELSVADAGAV
jgi:hypothetical protein